MNLVFASGFLVPQEVAGIKYFRGLEDRLKQATGHAVLFPRVDPLKDATVRGQQLADAIQAAINGGFPAGPIHIIAHSMAGLDSRVLIGNNLNGLAGRIASLTTLSTPHRGSPVADLLVGDGPDDARRAISIAIDRLGLNMGALINLTTKEANKVPDAVQTNPGIRYRSYLASGRPKDFLPFVPIPSTSAVLLPTYAFIKTIKGEDNDGLVTAKSATYGDVQETLECDHADMIGHNLNGPLDPFQFAHFDLFDRIIAQLERDGG
jgi:triacylglycerol lipase